jgi:NADPH:quinone reductase-like Zn-dependent oxidoreductase
MKSTAARLVEHGRPLTVTECDLSAPGAGEVEIDMIYGGVNPVDRYRAAGTVDADAPLPRTLGAGADHVVTAGAEELSSELGRSRPTVAFDPLGDGFTGAVIESLAPRGRLVILGTSAGPAGTIQLQTLYRSALRILGTGGSETPTRSSAPPSRRRWAPLLTGASTSRSARFSRWTRSTRPSTC